MIRYFEYDISFNILYDLSHSYVQNNDGIYYSLISNNNDISINNLKFTNTIDNLLLYYNISKVDNPQNITDIYSIGFNLDFSLDGDNNYQLHRDFFNYYYDYLNFDKTITTGGVDFNFKMLMDFYKFPNNCNQHMLN